MDIQKMPFCDKIRSKKKKIERKVVTHYSNPTRDILASGV